MVKSMTGFGRATYENEGREYIVEIKTLNHKYNDVSIKLNRNISYLEDFIRKTILNHISRGKIEVYISFADYANTGQDLLINENLIEKYIHDLKKIVKNNNIIDDISVMKLLGLPDVLTVKNNLPEDVIKNEIQYVMGKAIDNIIKMRKYEGEKIAEDIKRRITIIENKVAEISNISTGLIDKYIVKLNDRIKKVLTTDNIDKNILEQEVVLYADKTSIEEEITRLNSHCEQFIKLLEEEANIGKKLDFLTQEMNREINTIASKANCLDITKIVIDVKTEIENIREQVQNIE